MSIRGRLRSFLGIKQNPTVAVILATRGRDVIWTPTDYARLSEAGYKNCMTAFACVNLVTRSAAGVEWQVQDEAGRDVPKHPVLQRLNRPNELEGKRAFMTKTFGYLMLNGNAYILQVSVAGELRFLYSLRPDRIKILPGSGGNLVRGYRYEIGGQKQDFTPDQVLHVKLFNPTDDFYGFGMIEAARRGIDIANLSDVWNARLIQNDMRPPGGFTTDGSLTDPQYERLKEIIKEEYQGAENAGKPLLLEGGLKWTPFAISPKDMDWIKGEERTTRKICAVLGPVPPELIGDAEAKTYSNYQEARKALYTETVLPLMYFLRDDLQNWLMPKYGEGLVLDIKRDKIEALQEEREKKFAYLSAADWLTVNEKREATGYDRVGAEGDVILVPLGKVPLASALEPQDEPQEEEGEEEGSRMVRFKTKAGFWGVLERKERLWLSFEARVKARSRSFEQLARGYLKRQAEEVRKRAAAASSVGGLRATDLLDPKKEAKKYAETFWPWYVDHFIRAGNAGIRASKGELFDDAEFKAGNPKKPSSWVFNMTPEEEEILRDMVFNSGTEVNKTAIEKIFNLLETANAENWTIEQFTQEIWKTVSDFETWRARLWARTESAKVDNYGQLEGYKQTEFVEKKGWLCSFVEDSREEHKEADRRYSDDPIPLAADFLVGGESLAYPGDPKASPGNVCNCLCSTFPVVE